MSHLSRASSPQAGRLQKRGAGGALREFPGLGATQGATFFGLPKVSLKIGYTPKIWINIVHLIGKIWENYMMMMNFDEIWKYTLFSDKAICEKLFGISC